ncbi:MAG: hypothetical protein QM727_05305 [Niabella sp.]
MNKNTRNGLIALGLVAFAAWYKSSPEQKEKIKGKLSGIGNKLKDSLPQNIKGRLMPNGSFQ